MKLFTIADDLTEIERIRLLLFKKQDPLQQGYIFSNAKNIFSNNIDSI